MSMNDGGGMMELALLFGLVVFIVIGFVVLYLLYKFLKWLWRTSMRLWKSRKSEKLETEGPKGPT